MTLILDDITLPNGLIWQDEFSKVNVAQSSRRTLNGQVVVFAQSLTAGQTITLTSDSNGCWLTLAEVQAIQAKADAPGAVYVLQANGQSLNVVFKHDDPPAFDARPVTGYTDHDDYYTVTLKLMSI